MTLLKKNINKVLYRLDHDDDQDDFLLIAIKSNMPDYKIAFHLNKYLNIRLCKVIPEITVEDNGKSYFRSFKYEDEKNYLIWRLFENKSNHTDKINEAGHHLFDTNEEAF